MKSAYKAHKKVFYNFRYTRNIFTSLIISILRSRYMIIIYNGIY